MIPCLVSCFVPVRWLALAGLGVLLLWLSASVSCAARQPKPAEPPSSSSAFALTSTAFADTQPIPAQYTCKGADTSPPLAISGLPVGTKSMALVVDDPDAPLGTWEHWLLWNIPPSTTVIPAGSVPAGVVSGTNDFKKTGYGGPCPPFGTHRYFFKLYALDATLSLAAGAKIKALNKAMDGHVLGQAKLMGTVAH